MLVKNHPYQFVFYFFGDHEYLNEDTGEVIRKGNSYRGSPYEGKGLNTVFKFITQIMKSERKVLGANYRLDDQIPQKLKIFHHNQCIATIPSAEGETITDIRKNPQMLANALNEWEVFKLRFVRSNGNVQVLVQSQAQEQNKEKQLNEERNSVFRRLSEYCYHKLGYKLSKENNYALYEKIVAHLKIRIKDIPSYYSELQELIDREADQTEVVTPINFKVYEATHERTANEPTSIAETFKRTPKTVTKTQTDVSIFIEAAIDTLSKRYEKTNRKVTEEVRAVFENAFSRCKEITKIDSVFNNYLNQIEQGQF
ncbi:hypothetical protein [Bernardetia sp.]|uniref:hypothetical protein n=1 Tax=Bernardetia sp. TaxID=1937974 RepID=UPI0025C1A0D6|nr:hypothetical protein [Bernardetia sp.]